MFNNPHTATEWNGIATMHTTHLWSTPFRNHPGDRLFERTVQAPLLMRSYNNQIAIYSWLWQRWCRICTKIENRNTKSLTGQNSCSININELIQNVLRKRWKSASCYTHTQIVVPIDRQLSTKRYKLKVTPNAMLLITNFTGTFP